MNICGKDCIPCCDYCSHVIYEKAVFRGSEINAAPIGCSLHKEAAYQELAKRCSFCEDFSCSHISESKK